MDFRDTNISLLKLSARFQKLLVNILHTTFGKLLMRLKDSLVLSTVTSITFLKEIAKHRSHKNLDYNYNSKGDFLYFRRLDLCTVDRI